MKSIELFSGAGGLTLAIAKAGFHAEAIVEMNPDAMETLLLNQRMGNNISKRSMLHRMDVRDFGYEFPEDTITLLAGGPPCQPFSQGGKHAGPKDHRNMFPEVLRAVRALKPKAILIENVRGLVREMFSDYFNYILLGLRFPLLKQQTDESWTAHLRRLRNFEKVGKAPSLSYDIAFKVLNAADYGVPQKRERLFIVCTRSDLELEWEFPSPTHSFDKLLWDKWITGEYWKRHAISRRKTPKPHWKLEARLKRLQKTGEPKTLAWQTVRDALADLPPPHRRMSAGSIPNHEFYPGARSYHGHTGSVFDFPAKTLKAGAHGVPGGENMLALPDGSVRYFTIRECARLQTFPDDYVFSGGWCASVKQLGNAVPVKFGFVVARSLAKALKRKSRASHAK
jgi:DNA (cytosine-5)-methyltransferase 1